mgnify:CR=1 FL=1
MKKTVKYNRSQIFKNAWRAVKELGVSISEALKAAWAFAKKEATKVEAKEEAKDYSKMTVAELKEVAAEKNIDVAGMKKAEIIEALTK